VEEFPSAWIPSTPACDRPIIFAATVIDDPIVAPLLASQSEFTAGQDAIFTVRTDAAAEACGVPPLDR
jgi:hypothetical protein